MGINTFGRAVWELKPQQLTQKNSNFLITDDNNRFKKYESIHLGKLLSNR